MVGDPSSKYAYNPQQLETDIQETCDKIEKFKNDFMSLVKSSDLQIKTQKNIIIEAMYQLGMVNI